MQRSERRWPWIAGSIVVVALFVGSFVDVDLSAGGDPRPVGQVDDIAALAERSDLNVLFILIDTLRADRLGAYGYERDTSPSLDRLAASGIRFSRQLAQSSWTKASMASMWTGLNPLRNGVTKFDDMIPDRARMPAEVFRAAGFRTVGIYRNGWVSPNFGFARGFDAYTRPAPSRLPPSVRRENPTISEANTDEDAVKTAIEFLRVRGDDRWLLYLHLMDVHEYLYDETTALFGSSYSDVYDNSIRWTDRAVGHLLDYLDAKGLSKRTIVVVASDHGEAFRERGFEGHARVVYRESTEVPLLIQLPFRLEPGIVVGGRSRNVDIWPTVLELVGLEATTGTDGRSRVGDILASARGTDERGTPEVGIAHLDQRWGQSSTVKLPAVAVTEGTLRYVRTPLLEGGPSLEELFDAARDAAELEDLSEERVEDLVRLREMADAYLASDPEWGEAPSREISEFELNQLRALGYAIP